MTVGRTFGLVAAASVAHATPAQAHLVTTGLGPVYDGIGHVFASPDDLVPVIVMALLAGLNGPSRARRALFVLPMTWLLGGIAGYVAGGPPVPGGLTAVSFLVLGVLTAADRRLAPPIVTLLAAAVGLFHGWLNGGGIAESGRELLGIVGIVAAVFVLVALIAAFVVSLRVGWVRVVVRVAGSWAAASGLLMLGWSLRGAFAG